MDFLKLGASLYVPGIHSEITSIAKGIKYPNLKSVIIDTEDSISDDDLPFAYHNISKMLYLLDEPVPNHKPMVFIRTRNPVEFQKLANFEKIENIDGFVLPKFCVESMYDYMKVNVPDKCYMPVLEKDIFSLRDIEKIRDFLLPYKDKILSLRIGATDLLNSFSLRRDNFTTIYEIGFMSQLIANIVISFSPYGFNITGPVWESFRLDTKERLQQEVKLDLMNGLFGKSIIHPWQIDVVQDMYKVKKEDYEVALQLLDPYTPAVFKADDRMNEKATHTNWAHKIIEQHRIYGLKDK